MANMRPRRAAGAAMSWAYQVVDCFNQKSVFTALTLGVLLAFVAPVTAQTEKADPAVTPLQAAHAHNDYLHEKPLFDALAHGFCSVEADVFLVDGKLLVAHELEKTNPEKTLEKLYLAPLKARVDQYDGKVYPKGPKFYLMVDIKSDSDSTYEVLHALLGKYASILTSYKEGKITPGAVSVIVSGNRPRDLMKEQTTRYAGIDGRLEDLESEQTKYLIPMISDRWSKSFQWAGTGEISVDEKKKLESLVMKAHSRGQMIRFWQTPERAEVWKELMSAKVDFVNTDQLANLRQFLLRYLAITGARKKNGSDPKP